MESPTHDEIMLIYEQIKDWVEKTDEIDASSIIILVTLLIKCVESAMKDKTGTYKKDIVLKVLRKVIVESKLKDDAKASLLVLIETVIPVTIDTMINIAHKSIDLGKMKGMSRCLCFRF